MVIFPHLGRYAFQDKISSLNGPVSVRSQILMLVPSPPVLGSGSLKNFENVFEKLHESGCAGAEADI
jgi:hypothetical protein